MPQTSEFQIIQSNTAAKLQPELAKLAAQGFRPIFLSSASDRVGVITTVILEHVLDT